MRNKHLKGKGLLGTSHRNHPDPLCASPLSPLPTGPSHFYSPCRQWGRGTCAAGVRAESSMEPGRLGLLDQTLSALLLACSFLLLLLSNLFYFLVCEMRENSNSLKD